MQSPFLNPVFLGWIINSTLQFATPLVLTGLGGMFSERSGVVNIGLEGIMLMGAFFGVVGSWFTGNPWIGLLAAIISGAIIGLIHALVCVKLKGNQIVSGAGIILFASGFTTLMLFVIWGRGTSERVTALPEVVIPGLEVNPLLDTAIGSLSPLIYLMFLMVPICSYILYRTPLGLQLRAAGEDPSTLDAAGVNVETIRIIGVTMSGILGAIGGAHLSIGFGSSFVKLMTGGRGFIALAALIFGNWTPVGVFLAGMLFGFLVGLQTAIQVAPGFEFLIIAVQFIQMIPYVSVVVALGIVRRSIPPKAIGVPYIKEKRK